MPTDIEISRSVDLHPVTEVAKQLGIEPSEMIPYGHFKAKLPLSLINLDRVSKSNLILVSAFLRLPPAKARRPCPSDWLRG